MNRLLLAILLACFATLALPSDAQEFRPVRVRLQNVTPPSLRLAPTQSRYCPQCGRVHASTAAVARRPQRLSSSPRGQQIAQSRANYMARHHHRRHPPRSAGDFGSVGTFEGVGWVSNPSAPQGSVSTCVAGYTKGTRMYKGTHAGAPDKRLVGDAVARTSLGTYRVRIWR